MLSFGSFFKYAFKTKNKTVNLLLLLQFAVVVVAAIWSAIANSQLKQIEKWSQGIEMVGITSFIVIFIYIFISIINNEKINSSQTWQLLPISSKSFYLVNLLTSILNAIYLVFMQVIMALVVLIPLTAFREFRSGVGEIWHKIIEVRDIILKDSLPIFILIVIFLLLFLIAIYIFVTTINFVSTLLVEQVSKNNSRIARFILIVVLVVITFIIGINLIDLLDNINFFSSNTFIEWGQADIILLGIDIIFTVLNVWLLKNYHEGR